MSKGFAVSFDMSIGIAAVSEAFSAFGEKSLPRATQFCANRVAIDAVRRFRERVPKVLDNPTEATVDAASYKLDREALNAITRLDQVKATVYINPVASIWLKYAFGDGTNRREPGDVGLAETAIKLPVWDNIKIVFGVGPDRHGNVPRGLMPKIKALQGRPQVKGSWGVYETTMTVRGQERTALVGRPPTKTLTGTSTSFIDPSKPEGKKRRKVTKVVATDIPRVLFIDAPHADYEPMLQEPWDQSLLEAAGNFSQWMQDELDEKRWHQAGKEARAERQSGDVSQLPAFLRS